MSLFANTVLISCQKAVQCAVSGIGYSQYVEQTNMFFCDLELLFFRIFSPFFRIIVSYLFRIFLYFLKIVHLEAVDSPRTLQAHASVAELLPA